MTEITGAEIKRIAQLARLAIEPEYCEKYQQELTNILQLINKLNCVNTEQVEPLSHPLNLEQRLHADQVNPQALTTQELLQQNAPDFFHNYYLVPQAVE